MKKLRGKFLNKFRIEDFITKRVAEDISERRGVSKIILVTDLTIEAILSRNGVALRVDIKATSEEVNKDGA